MSEYIITPTTEKGADATCDGALDRSQSGHDTPVMEGGTAVPFPNSDLASSVSADPIGTPPARHARKIFPEGYVCSEPACLKVFENAGTLSSHARSTKHKSYRCECDYARPSAFDLDEHVSRAKYEYLKSLVHAQASFEKAHTCAENGCRRVFPNGSKIEEHARVNGHKAFRCLCGKGFSKLCSLGRHIDECRDGGTAKYTCPLQVPWSSLDRCGSSFKRLAHLEQHLRADGVFGHGRTAKEAQDDLLPFRKRKPATFTTAVASDEAATAKAAHDIPILDSKSQTTKFDSSTSKNGSPRNAFLALTMGAVPSSRDASTTTPTAGAAQGSPNLQELSADLMASPLGDGGFSAMTSMSPLQVPERPKDVNLYAEQASELSSPSVSGQFLNQSTYGSAYGGHPDLSTGVYQSICSAPALGGPFTGANTNAAMWAAPFTETPLDGYGRQYNNMPSMQPNSGAFINQSGLATVYGSPMDQTLLQSAPFNQVQMGWLPPNAYQMPMGNVYGYHGALQSNFGSSALSPPGFNEAFWPQTLNTSEGESLYGTSATALQPQVVTGLTDEGLDVFDFAEDTTFYNA